MAEILYHDPRRALTVQAARDYTPEMVALLEKTVWGTRGVLYIKHHLATHLGNLSAPWFFSLTESGVLTAMAVATKKTVRVGRRDYAAMYLAAFAVEPARISQGYGRLLLRTARPFIEAELGATGLLYGFVEGGNTRSLGLFSQVFIHDLGLFHIQPLHRFFPRDDRRVGPAREEERDGLLEGLYELYADHAFLDFATSLRLDRYFVLRENGRIVAGVQGEVWEWSILRLPGLRGFILAQVLARLPGLTRWFNTRPFRFLRLGNLYVRPGRETEVFRLAEALLARHRVYFAMANLDRRSPVCQRLAGAGDFGCLTRNLTFAAHVMADCVGLLEEEIADLSRRPLVVSPLDAL